MIVKSKIKSPILHGFKFVNHIFPSRTLVPYYTISQCFFQICGFNNYSVTDPMPEGVGNLRLYDWQAVDLSYTVFKPPKLINDDAIIIIHGMLGSKENWKSIAIRLCRSTGRNTFTVDLRNHGSSPRDYNFAYPYLAADVYQVMKKHGLDKYGNTIIGHSVGGRTAMTIALDQPQMVYDIIIVDITPVGSYPQPYYWKELLKLANTLVIPPHFDLLEACEFAEREMNKSMESRFLRSFIQSNLYKDTQEERFKWKVYIPALEKTLSNILYMPAFGTPFKGPSLFISGERSNYINDQNVKETCDIFPNASFEVFPRSGHAVHEDQPEEFLLKVEDFLIDVRWTKKTENQ